MIQSEQYGQSWRPSGDKIGWIDLDNNDLYLIPDAAYKVAQRMAEEGERIEVQSKTLHRRLYEKGMLKTTDLMKKRGTATIRKVIDDVRVEVLHLPAEVVGICSGQEE